MQPFSIAISQPGIQKLMQNLLGAQIAAALEGGTSTLPDNTFPVDDCSHQDTTPPYETYDYSNITISLTGGTLKLNPVFASWVQGPDDNSQFTITINAPNVEVDYNWTETYAWTGSYVSGDPPVIVYDPLCGPPYQANNTYPYSDTIDNLSITAVFQLAVGTGGYQLTYVSSTASPGTQQPNIPGGSILATQKFCGQFTDQVKQVTQDHLDQRDSDCGDWVTAKLKPIFASIADSGKLGPVEFDFLTPGDSGLVFPKGGGIQIGAAGGVTVNGVPYAAPAPPPPLALPPVPTGSPPPDVAFFIQDYEVNALFWGFQAAGVLKTTLSAGNLVDPQALETNTYAGGQLNNLALKYPGLLMTADLAALEAPTVAFQTVYEFNAKNLQDLQEALGATVWSQFGDEIGGLNGMAFSSQSGLETELSVIDSALLTYAPTIEKCTGLSGVVVTHTTRCVLNVCPDKGKNPIPVITFDVAQTFLMDGLQLGQSSSGTGTVQSVIFAFKQPMNALPKASFVSSTIPGVDGGDFIDVWNALRPNWQGVFAQVGTAGMPLPHIPGFDFLFSQATVAVVPAQTGADGYLSVTASMTYSAEGLTPAVRQAIARPAVAA